MTSQERLDRFDVFVSYKPEDRTAAELLSLLLWDRGIQVYMDTWYLQPGTPWIQALEQIVANTRTMIVLVGAHGLGPWQKRETYIALERQLTDQNFPVIPVLLPGCNESDLPPFLRLLVWIDFREGLRNPAAIAAQISAVKCE